MLKDIKLDCDLEQKNIKLKTEKALEKINEIERMFGHKKERIEENNEFGNDEYTEYEIEKTFEHKEERIEENDKFVNDEYDECNEYDEYDEYDEYEEYDENDEINYMNSINYTNDTHPYQSFNDENYTNDTPPQQSHNYEDSYNNVVNIKKDKSYEEFISKKMILVSKGTKYKGKNIIGYVEID
jgi:hypothetical protein